MSVDAPSTVTEVRLAAPNPACRSAFADSSSPPDEQIVRERDPDSRYQREQEGHANRGIANQNTHGLSSNDQEPLFARETGERGVFSPTMIDPPAHIKGASFVHHGTAIAPSAASHRRGGTERVVTNLEDRT